MKRRFLHSDNGTFIDLSMELNNYESGTTSISFTAAEDYLYIATTRPFNHLYFKNNAVNVDVSLISAVEVYQSRQWSPVVEVFDGTEVSGTTFAQSEYITFVPDRHEAWGRVADTSEEELGFSASLKIYDMYWSRISFTADCTLDLSWVGHLFVRESVLGTLVPDLAKTKVKSIFNNTYEPQIKLASDMLIDDLRVKRIITDENQILEREDLEIACAYKTAAILYGNRGPSYEDDRSKYEAMYASALVSAYPVVDKNNDGRVSAAEQTTRQNRFFK